MASGVLCCSLFRALSLDPVPVIGSILYVPGAEGLDLSELDNNVTLCPNHKFSYRNITSILLRSAANQGQCNCELGLNGSTTNSVQHPTVTRVDRFKTGSANNSILWTYEMNHLVTLYKWMSTNRTRYPKCCSAVVVYQIKKSSTLPPGFYVYSCRPRHFGCTVDRPIAVLEQFNGIEAEQAELPDAISIDMFPGCDNYSAMYIITRTLAVESRKNSVVPEFGNRIYGEASALGILDYRSPGNVACKHHEVAIRNDRMCVFDLRWRGMETKTACLRATPKIRGLKAVLWSNHSENVQDIESSVLTWLFGLSNELPQEVQIVDHTNEILGIRYIVLDMDSYAGVFPQAPCETESFYMHTYFSGDRMLANAAIGSVSENRSRMGTPSLNPFEYWYMLPSKLGSCNPTPFSCGMRTSKNHVLAKVKEQLVDWTRGTDGADCHGLAVQHTLYYHAERREYKMMITHTIVDSDTTLSMFKL